jgi:putative oxygen-independent coproporphyrinogen III oxidase
MFTPPPLALYIHIPWCVRKCPYCDFNSHNAPAAIPQREYVDALLADLDLDLAWVAGREVVSIFFGGGTPSLFSAENIARILDGVATRLVLQPGLEISLETNPGTVEHDSFSRYRRAGVNRISFGVQSFADAALKRIGRIHDAAQAETAIKSAQDAGIDNLNLDLMYALPEQTLAQALLDVEKGILLQTPHFSHYQLTLEPNTVFAAKPPPLPDHDSAWDMQEACQARLAEAGFAHYEVSAYAKPGQECRHNQNYWRFGDYLGIGAGAHGKLSRADGEIRRRWKVKHPAAYLRHADTPQRLGGDDIVIADQLPFEFMLNALRLTGGFALSEFTAHTGLPLTAIQTQLEDASTRGWLTIENDWLRPSDLGQRFLNDVMQLFLRE